MGDTYQFGKRLRDARIRAGTTQASAAKTVNVRITTWRAWEQGLHSPKVWRLQRIAQTLGCPLAVLLVDDAPGTCVAEVWLSASTVRELKRSGRAQALAVAEDLARALEPLIWQAATGRIPRDTNAPARSKPRRSRAEVLAGVRQAAEMRAARDLRELEGELRTIEAERVDDDG